MTRRKTPDSGNDTGHKIYTRRKKCTENKLVAIEDNDMSNMSVNETDTVEKTCVIPSNYNSEAAEGKDFNTSLQTADVMMTFEQQNDASRSVDADLEKKYDAVATIDRPSTDVKSASSIQPGWASLNGKDNPIDNEQSVVSNLSPSVKDEGKDLSESADADTVKKSCILPETDSNSSTAMSISSKIYKKNYSRRVKKKTTETKPEACDTFPIAQDCTSSNTTVLSEIGETGFLRKITDEETLGENLVPPVWKEKSVLTVGACPGPDKSGMLPEINSNPDTKENNSNGYKETESKAKMDVIYVSLCGSEVDQIDPSTVSAALPESLVGTKIVDPSVETNLIPDSNAEDSEMTEIADDISPGQSSALCKIDSDCYRSVDPSIQSHTSKEKALDKIDFSLCSMPENMPASEELQRLRDDKVKHVISEVGVSDSGLKDESSGISAERSLKALSTDYRETPSPIRGVMHDSASLVEPNKKNNQLDSLKEKEANFSFQIAEKVRTVESSDDCFEVCATGSRDGSDKLLLKNKKNDDVNSMSTCIDKEKINCEGENQVASLSMSIATENVLPSEVFSTSGKKPEASTLAPESALVRPARKKLLVLDLNGLLADIILDIRHVHKAQKKVGGKSVFKRPFCDDFLKFCFERFDIGIWSSRRKYNVDNTVDFLLGDSRHKLLFCWDESKCTYTGFRTLENAYKPLVLKELKKLWNKEETDLPWEKGDYSPSNTLLLDDSPYKALCNPPHTAIFPYPYHFDNENDTSLGPGGDIRVYLEGLAAADDVQCYVQEHPFGQQAISTSDKSWSFYLQVIEKVEKSLAPSR